MNEKTNKNEISFCMNFTKFYKYILSLILFSFPTCIILSLIFHFEKVTTTSCNVKNYLPSVSAATGELYPQKFIWQYTIAFLTPFRLVFPFAARNFYISFHRQNINRHALVQVMMWVEVLEVLSLLLLTIVSSTEAYWWHEKAFVTFVLSAQVNMLVKIVMFISLREHPQFSNNMERSLWMKVTCWFVNFTSIFLAAYFFYRHNTYCESGVYTLFALSEYVVVMSNIFFHATGFIEFSNSMATINIGSYHKIKMI